MSPIRLQEASRTSRHIDATLWGASLAIVVAILIFSWATKPPLSSFRYADKIGHALAYAALTGALLLAAVWRPGPGCSCAECAGARPGARRKARLS